MKAFRIITHPFILSLTFMLILIRGEQIGGFYLWYLLLALPHGSVHAVTGFLGIVILLFNGIKSKQLSRDALTACINLLGGSLMWLSLFLFFYNDKSNYNISTFYELVPLIALLIFVSISICFFVDNILLLLKNSNNKIHKPSVHE